MVARLPICSDVELPSARAEANESMRDGDRQLFSGDSRVALGGLTAEVDSRGVSSGHDL